MYTYDVQYPEFTWDQVREMGPVDLAGALAAFSNFPFRDLIAKADTLGDEATAPTIMFRSPSDKSSLGLCMRSSEHAEIYMEHDGQTVTVGPADPSFMMDSVKSFFSGNHSDLFERLAEQPVAVTQRGLWKRLKVIFATK